MHGRHMGLNLEKGHFDARLEGWRRPCAAHLGAAEAGAMIEMAENISRDIRRFVEVAPSP